MPTHFRREPHARFPLLRFSPGTLVLLLLALPLAAGAVVPVEPLAEICKSEGSRLKHDETFPVQSPSSMLEEESPEQELEKTKDALARELADFALEYEAILLGRGRLTCVPREQEEPRVGPPSQESVFDCEPVSQLQPPRMPSFLHRRESLGRLTINGEDSGGIAVHMLANSVAYQSDVETVVLVSMFNLDRMRHWRLGEYALRREATGEPVRVRFVREVVAEDGEDSSPFGLMVFVLDTPRSGTERFVLEALEKKDDSPRRLRVEGMTFEEPVQDAPAR